MRSLVCAGAGFLLAVLWFDLMFDVQVMRRGAVAADLRTDAAVKSIATYYRRVTTDARPMNRLIALIMLVTAGAIVGEIVRGDVRGWVAWTSLCLAVGPITLAATRTVPSAVRLGSRRDPSSEQFELARAILRQHLVCVTAIAGLLVVQIAFGG